MLRVRGVTVAYASRGRSHTALRGVDIDVSEGEFVAIVGPSGSGKTTLLNVLGGLHPPTTGSVELFGRALQSMGEDDRTALRLGRVGYVFQEYNLIAALSALENVALPLELAGVHRSESNRRAARALDAVALGHVAAQFPETLSGGEQQRVAIARAVAIPRALVFCDEPTGALDSASTEALLRLLHELGGAGATFVVATHDPLVSAAATRLVHLLDGRVTAARAQAP